MYRAFRYSHCGLFHRFRQCRMRVARACDIFGGSTELHRDRGLCNHVPCVRAYKMHTEHTIGLRVGDNFHKALGRQIDFGPTIGCEGKLPDIIGDACGLQLFLGLPDRGDLGICVNYVRNSIVINVPRLPDQNLSKRHALVFGLVRQHWTRNHVADGPDAGNIGRIVVINDHASAFVELDPEFLETQTLGVRHPTDRDQNDIGLDRFQHRRPLPSPR